MTSRKERNRDWNRRGMSEPPETTATDQAAIPSARAAATMRRPLVRIGPSAVRWFGRLGRRFVVLKDSHNFAKKSLFLFLRVRIRRVRLAIGRRLGPRGRWRQ